MAIPMKIIGRVENITIPDGGVVDLPAKIDTGAYRSSIWATKIKEKDGTLFFTLLGSTSPYYSGKGLSTDEYKLVEVENSFGHKQRRYSIFLKVKIGNKTVKSNFTLANRAMKTYSALVGRKLLRNKFLVNVAAGNPIQDEETNGDEGLE